MRHSLRFEPLFALLLGLLALVPQVDPDAWWHLRIAADAQIQGALPTGETLSWLTRGEPWREMSPLTGLLLLGAERTGGATAQSLLFLPVWTGIGYLLLRLQARLDPRRSRFSRAVAAALVVFALGPVIAPRAASVDPLFALLTLGALLAHRERAGGRMRSRRLWILIPVAVLWANLHGPALALLPALCTLWIAGGLLAGERPTRAELFIPVVALLIASLLNPNGWEPLLYPLRHPLGGGGSPILEWQTLPLDAPAGLLPRLFIAASLALAGLGGSVLAPRHRLLLFAVAVYALGSTRALLVGLPLLAVLVGPALVGALASLRPARVANERLARLAPWALLLALVPAALGHLVAVTPDAQARWFAAHYPSERLTRMSAVCPRVANAYDWGGWLAWRRAETAVGAYGGIYGAPFEPLHPAIARQAAIESGALDAASEWRADGVDAALLPLDSPPARDLLAAGWTDWGRDGVAVLLLAPDGRCLRPVR